MSHISLHLFLVICLLLINNSVTFKNSLKSYSLSFRLIPKMRQKEIVKLYDFIVKFD